MYSCPVCEGKLETWKSQDEEGEECPPCNYMDSYSYGVYWFAVGKYHFSYSSYTPEKDQTRIHRLFKRAIELYRKWYVNQPRRVA